MSVETSTKVSADLNASGFTAGAQQIERALGSMGRAAAAAGTEMGEKLPRQTAGAATALDRLLRTIDRATKAQQDYDRAVKQINAGMQRGSFGDPASTAAVEKYNRAIEQAGAYFLRLETSAQKAARAEREVADAARQAAEESARQATNIERLRQKYDPLYAAQQKYKQSLQEITTLERAGALTSSAAERERALAAQGYQRNAAAMRNLAPASRDASNALKLQAHEWTNLSYQAQDFVVQIASGQGLFYPLIQQGPQAIGAVGGVGNALKLLANPLVIAGAAFVATAGAAALLMARYSDLQGEARSFGVALQASNTAIGSSVAQLQEYTRALERQGVEREKARAAILELARTPNISGQTRQDIATLLPDFAAGQGLELNEALRKLIELATGGREAVFKLQDQIGFMSAAQQESVQRFFEQGRAADALKVVFEALEARFRGLNEQGLSPQAQALQRLRNSWTEFMDGLASSRPVIAAVELLTSVLQRLATTTAPANTTASLLEGVDQQIEQTQARLDRLRAAMSRMAPSVRSSADTVIPGEVGPGSPLDRERQLMEQLAGLDAQRLALMDRQRQAAEGTEGSLRRQANITPAAGTGSSPAADPEAAARAESERQTGIVARLRGEVDALAAAHSRGGNAVAEYRARTAALAEAQRLNLNVGNTALLVEQRLREARLGGANASGTDRIRERTQELTRETEAGVRLNQAIEQGLPGLLRAQAETQALADVDGRRTTALDAQTQAILNRNAAQEASKGAETVVNLQQEIAAAERLANASGLGAQAEAAATLENNIEQATARMRAYAQVTTDPRIAAALNAQADRIEEQKRQLAQLNELARNRRAIVAAEMQNEYTQREIELVGANVVERERELAILRERQNLRREGLSLDTEEAQRRVALAAQNAEDSQELSRRRELYQELGNFGTQAFERIGEAITQSFVNGQKASVQFKNVAKAVLSEIIQLALKLAVINPIANWMTGSNRATLFDIGARTATASGAATAVSATGNSMGTASAASSGATLLGGFPRFSDGVVTSGAGAVFAPGYQFSTPVGFVNSGLNAPAVSGISYGQLGAGALGIAGGAYGVYSGLQTGGAKGYTQAAGGAVGVAGGAAGLAVASGATAAGGALAGAAGTAIAATAAWAPYIAAALIIASMLMPGPKQSNAAAGANINLSTGVVNLENSGKETAATSEARDKMVALVKDTTDQLGKLLGVTASGVIGFELGQRDPSRVVLNGQQIGTAGVGDSQKLADILGKAILQSFSQAPGLLEVQQRILDASGSNVDFAVQLLQQTKAIADAYGSEALNPDRNPVTRAIYNAAVQTGSIETVVAALKGAAELTAAYGDALNTAEAIQVVQRGGANIEKIVSDLQWLFEVYKPLTGATTQISALDEAIRASNKTYDDAIKRANELGLATDVLATKQAEAAEKIRQSLRDSYDNMLAEAQGRGTTTQTVASATAIRANWNANALDYLKVGRDPNQLYAAQMTALFKELDISTLERVVTELKGLDEVAALFAQAALDAAKATAQANAASSYEAQLREATGAGWVNQIIELSNTVAANADAYRAAGKDPTVLYAAQVKQIIDGLDANALATAAQYLQGLDTVAQEFVTAAVQTANAAQQLAAAAQIAADAADYDAKMRQALGLELVNTIVAIRKEVNAMADRYIAAGRDPGALATAQIGAALSGQSADTLAKTAAGLQGLDSQGVTMATAELVKALQQQVADAQKVVADAAAQQQDAADSLTNAGDTLTDSGSSLSDAAYEQQQAAQQMAAAGQQIKDYITGLKSSASAGYSPQQRLTNAQTAYNADLALAQQGNIDALNRITSSADALIQAGRDYYGSTAAFASLRDSIITQLTALPAVQSADQQIIDKLSSIATSTEGTRTNVASGNSSLSTVTSNTATTNTALAQANALLASIDTNNDGIITIDEINAAAQAKITAAQSTLTAAAQQAATNTGATKTAIDTTKNAIDLNTNKAAEVKGEITSNNEISLQVKTLNQTLTDAATSSTGGFVALGTLLSNLTKYAAAGAFNTMYTRPTSTEPGISISSALGNMFDDGRLIMSRTLVPMSEMGERGPEAVMPLGRGPDGALGIRAFGGGVANDNSAADAVYALLAEFRAYRSQSAKQSAKLEARVARLESTYADGAAALKRVASR